VEGQEEVIRGKKEQDAKRRGKEARRRGEYKKLAEKEGEDAKTGEGECSAGITISLRMEKFAVSVDTVKKKRLKRGRSRVLFLMRFCRSFCILVAMTMHRALSF
jgi:hypothetical protein